MKISPLFSRLILAATLLATPLWGQDTEPTLNRAQQERLARILGQAESDPGAALEAAMAVEPGERDAVLWRWIADQQSAVEQYPAALEAYAGALGVLPTYRDALLNYARAALAADQPKTALPAVQSALGAGVRDLQLLEALALLAEAMGDAVVAEAAHREILLLDATRGASREGLVRVLLQQERYGEAEGLVRQLIERQPGQAGLWRLYADLAQSRGETELAVRRLETATRLGAVEAADRKRLMELYAVLDRPLEVLRLYRAVPEARADLSLRLRLAEGLLGLGHAEAAGELTREVPSRIAAREDRLRLARVRAHLLLYDDKPGEAAALVDEALKDAPLDPGLLRLAGEAWMQADDPRAAAPYFERLSRQPGHQARGLWLQGVAEARAGDVRRAVELLEAARRVEDLPGLRRTLEQVRAMRE